MGSTIETSRSDAARRAAELHSEHAHQAPQSRGAFRNPFTRPWGGPSGGNRGAAPLGSHVRNLATPQSCQTAGALSATVEPHKSEPKKRKSENIFNHVIHTAGDIAGKGLDVAGDVLKKGGEIALGPTKLVIDQTGKGIDFIGDVAGPVAKPLGEALKFAGEHGLKLMGGAREAARNLVRGGIDKAFNVGDHIRELGVNDSFSLGGGASVALGVGGGADGQLQITKTSEGFTVSTELNAHLGLGLEANADGGLGGKAEFRFKTAEEAKRAALIIASSTAAAADPVLMPALAPSRSETDFLRNNLSSLDVTASVSGKVDDKFGAGPVDAGAEASGEVAMTYRVEFEEGKPTALVRSTTVSVSAGVDAALKLVEGPLGRAVGDKVSAAVSQGGEVKGAVTVETRLRLDSARPIEVAELLTSPAAAVFAGGAETSVKASFSLDAGDKGFEAEVGVSNVSLSDASQVARDLVHGRFGDAFEGLNPSASFSDFRDGGLNQHLDLQVAHVGIDIKGYVESRDVRHHYEAGMN